MLKPELKRLTVFLMLLYVFLLKTQYTAADIFAVRNVSNNKFSGIIYISKNYMKRRKQFWEKFSNYSFYNFHKNIFLSMIEINYQLLDLPLKSR